MKSRRKVIALMFTDIVGYGIVSSKNEALALSLLDEYRAVLRRVIPLYGGRENKTIGDGFFLEFGSAIEAVLCAIDVQSRLHERNLLRPKSDRLLARIGIHLGDVVLNEGDSFGNGVNVAARTEAKAEPGGICLTRQIADQVSGETMIQLESTGTHVLKHVPLPIELFRVRLPWQKRAKGTWAGIRALGRSLWSPDKARAGQDSSWLNQSAFVTIVSVLLLIGVRAYQGSQAHTELTHQPKVARVLSSVDEAAQKFSLEADWEYSLAPLAGNVDSEWDINGMSWSEYKAPNWKYADKLTSPYILRRKFSPAGAFAQPAIVLGVIPGAHRVYLNGKFIGGANHQVTLVYYGFDRGLLKLGETNWIYVQIIPKKNLGPGINVIPGIGAYLGEFGDIYEKVTLNELSYHVTNSIYLAVALLLFGVCLAHYFYNRQDRKYLYFSGVLLLGAVALLYYSGLVADVVEYRFHRSCKLFGLSLSSMLLLSTYFHLIGNVRLEKWNNLLATIVATGFFVALSMPESGVESYLRLWNVSLGGTLIYSFLWSAGILLNMGARLLRGREGAIPVASPLKYEIIVLFFGVLTGMLALSSMKTETSWLVLPPLLRDWLTKAGNTYPFLFASFVLTAGVFDHIFKARKARYHRSKEEFLLGLAETVKRMGPSDELLTHLQQRIAEFLGAQRSTLYVAEKREAQTVLRARGIVSDLEGKQHIRGFARKASRIIAYVCQSRSPILIKNLSEDSRFQEHLTQRDQLASQVTYKSRTCMLFPLVIGTRLIGVLTLADKAGDEPFNRGDFELAHLVCQDLALIVDNTRLAGRVSEPGTRS